MLQPVAPFFRVPFDFNQTISNAGQSIVTELVEFANTAVRPTTNNSPQPRHSNDGN
jgi:hypothetical protein